MYNLLQLSRRIRLKVDSNHDLSMSISTVSQGKKNGNSPSREFCARECRPVEEVEYDIQLRRRQLV
jgi:hypothetical protein